MVIKFSNLARILFDKETGDIIAGNDIPFDGEVIMEQFVQNTGSETWTIPLKTIGVIIIVNVYENVEDGSKRMVNPDTVQQVGPQNVVLTFSRPVAGIANVLVSSGSQEGELD